MILYTLIPTIRIPPQKNTSLGRYISNSQQQPRKVPGPVETWTALRFGSVQLSAAESATAHYIPELSISRAPSVTKEQEHDDMNHAFLTSFPPLMMFTWNLGSFQDSPEKRQGCARGYAAVVAPSVEAVQTKQHGGSSS